MKQYWRYIFILLLIAAGVVLALEFKSTYFLLKFSLMPVLITGLLHNKKDKAEKNWRVILAGLVTSWAGDVLLLFSSGMELFFILGLVCFLATHIAYTIYFSRYHDGVVSRLEKTPLISALIVLYSLFLLSFLWPYLGGLLLPVIAYTVIITVMVMQAWSAKPHLLHNTGSLFFTGAIFFVVSDSLLAIAKFYRPFFLSDTLIIVTYGIAQLLIVHAAIKNTDAKQEAISYHERISL